MEDFDENFRHLWLRNEEDFDEWWSLWFIECKFSIEIYFQVWSNSRRLKIEVQHLDETIFIKKSKQSIKLDGDVTKKKVGSEIYL